MLIKKKDGMVPVRMKLSALDAGTLFAISDTPLSSLFLKTEELRTNDEWLCINLSNGHTKGVKATELVFLVEQETPLVWNVKLG
ncbi:hypothetical protein [Vibrio phage RYC]|nr:hypothetical protein [Vibrio phage RYC]